jgi:saccharopine dehydrogenase-like NADP-dependent oxidoreductase
MAKTTGYTAAIIARMLARGAISGSGIKWPVRIIKGELFRELMSSLHQRGVIITENILKTTTM